MKNIDVTQETKAQFRDNKKELNKNHSKGLKRKKKDFVTEYT